jgi:hypothetical protein
LLLIFQGLTSTAVKKGGLYSLDVNAVYKYKNTLVDVKLDTQSNVSDVEFPVFYFFPLCSLWLVVTPFIYIIIFADHFYLDCLGCPAIHKACDICQAA